MDNSKDFSQLTLYGLRLAKTCLRQDANNKGADQPVHPHSLINTFFIRLLESISGLTTSDISYSD